MAEIEEKLLDTSLYESGKKDELQEILQRQGELKQQHEELEEQWMLLNEQLETLEEELQY
ncbi:ABC transporter2C ATP-binding protein2C putative [gamma proteobacterium IMCC2047]|nr:ABC transporter2C ATP-binding protein2C putative [gamma proteobacterium IMCC2047]